jgi:hypothetical protein
MKKVLCVVFAGCVVIAFAQFGFAQVGKMAENDGPKPGAVKVEAQEGTATVDAIDYENRTGMLKLLDGTMLTFKAGPEVRDFEQVKVGDRVLIRE